MSRRVVLPYSSFLTAWLALDLGEVPTALLPGRVAPRTGETRASITERAWADLNERDLAAGHQLSAEFEATLHRMATSATRFYAYFHHGDGDTRSVLVAGAAVIAMIDGNEVTLSPCRTTSGARALIGALPEAPAATGEALSAPAEELARQSGTGVLSAVRPTGRAVRMRAILAEPRTGGGQLYAARMVQSGHFKACAQPLSYFDTSSGRYLAAEHEGADGTRWRTLVPADMALLVERLDKLLPR